MKPPTSRQRRVLTAIRELTADHHGRPPTIREIGARVGLTSTSSVNHHIHALAQAGHLVFDPGTRRSVRVVGEPSPVPETIREALDHLPMWAAQHIHDVLEGCDPAELSGYDRAALACADYLTRVTAARWDHEHAEVAS